MMRYVLGLDIGIASIGWAMLELDANDEPFKIINLNSRIFTKAENAKDGASLALPRREARGQRRRLRRRRHRLERVRHLLAAESVLTREQLQHLYDLAPEKDVYSLRLEGLERCLQPEEWARILIHFAKHRGFKSNRKSEAVAGDEGKVLAAVRANEEIMAGYRSVGEMLALDDKFRAKKRNTNDSYLLCVSRAMLEKEIVLLFEKQRQYGNPCAEEKLEQRFIDIFSSQRAFDEGPGGNSPYGGDQIEKMIGRCALDKKEKHAPKASYSFIKFNLLQKVNHLTLSNEGNKRPLTKEERQKIIELAWKKAELSYQNIRKELKIPYNWCFTDIFYKYEKDLTTEELYDKAEKGRKFNWTKPYHDIRKALDKRKKNRISELSEDELNIIAYAFTVHKTDTKIRKALEDGGIEAEDIEALLANLKTFTKFGHLSIKACKNINAYLEKGMIYSDACAAAGYAFQGEGGEKTLLLPAGAEELQEIPNPVVKRALSQTIKVVNSIIRKYGSPVEVHVELAREMARTFRDRLDMEKDIDANRAKNEAIKQELQTEHNIINPTGLDIVKWKLFKEQQGICAYSVRPMDVEKVLHDAKYAEVDHIIPYSRSFDDSMNNKVLVLAAENQHKSNRTPLEYFAGDAGREHAFREWVRANVRNGRKRENLLRVGYSKQAAEGWKERHLTDTKYISRFFYNFLCQHLLLAEGKRKKRIIPVNGSITSYVRKRLGINKIREDGDLHHAVDAVVIACITQGVVKRITDYSKWQEIILSGGKNKQFVDHETGEIITKENFDNYFNGRFPEPWYKFRQELDARVSERPGELIKSLRLPSYSKAEIEELRPCFVSRMPNRKVTGSAHDETIRSARLLEQGASIVKTDLSKLKLDKTGEIAGYFNPASDKLLYEALKARLQQFGGSGKEAFAEPFYKPKADGTRGPLVKKVKIMNKTTLNVAVNGGRGIADNGGMVRVDVYHIQEGKDKGYYLVPVYIADTKKKILPNRAAVAFKAYDAWKIMEEQNFCFSLYANDLVYIQKKDGVKQNIRKDFVGKSTLPQERIAKEGYYYYTGTDISVGSISVLSHDGVYLARGIGVKTLLSIRKCVVDVFGEISFVKKEIRQGF